MGGRPFNRFQYGKESTRGTPVAATRYLLADPKPLAPDRKYEFVEDAIGLRARSMRAVVDQYLVKDSLKLSKAYYQALPVLFSCGLKGNVTPTETTGGQQDYLWTFTPSLAAANNPDSITLEEGDDTQAVETEYVMFESLKFSGQIAQEADASPVAIEAAYFGRQHTPTSFTGALSLPTVEPMNAKLTRFYLDSAWAGVGGTEKTGLLRTFDVEILTGVHPKFHGGANRYFDTHAEGFIDVMASFVLEYNADADAIWDAWRAGSLAVVRLDISGAQIGTGTNHNLKLDIGGRWDEPVPMSSEENSNNLFAVTLHGMYDPTGAKLLQAAVTTNQNAI